MSVIWILIVAAIFAGVATILATIAIVYAFLAHSKVVGLQNSTHQISWMPIDPDQKPTEAMNEKELQQKFNDMYNDLESEHI